VSNITRAITGIVIGSLIFAGLPLLGWGITDVQGFVNHPARFGYILVVVLLQIVIVIKFPIAENNGGKGTKTVQRQKLALVLIQVFSIAVIITAPFSDRHDIGVWFGFDAGRYIGLGLFAMGFFAVNWAQASLGKQFSIQVARQIDHQLVTGGPYQYIRHPRYLSIIVFNVGLCLVFHSWLALITLAFLAIVLLWRIHDEEIFMHREFGGEWDTYAGKSWRLIPYIY
jgi:protein-S-isoprenylcysteine O-methyltransferase Ste14